WPDHLSCALARVTYASRHAEGATVLELHACLGIGFSDQAAKSLAQHESGGAAPQGALASRSSLPFARVESRREARHRLPLRPRGRLLRRGFLARSPLAAA